MKGKLNKCFISNTNKFSTIINLFAKPLKRIDLDHTLNSAYMHRR